MLDLDRITDEQRQNVLRAYGLEGAKPFASGTEAEVYGRDHETLLKLYAGGFYRAAHLNMLRDFYQDVISADTPLPEIRSVTQFESDNLVAVIETRLDGKPLKDLLPDLQGNDLERAENLYLDAVFSLKKMRLKGPRQPIRYMLIDDDNRSERGIPFEMFYARHLGYQVRSVERFFQPFNESFPAKASALVTAIQNQPQAPLSIVHGDLYPGNILVNDAADRVMGIIDFGTFTLFGNYLIDVAGAFGWYKMYDPERKAVRAALLPKVLNRLTEAERPQFFQFLLANAIMTSNFYASDPDPREDGHFLWAVDIVSEESYWEQALG